MVLLFPAEDTRGGGDSWGFLFSAGSQGGMGPSWPSGCWSRRSRWWVSICLVVPGIYLIVAYAFTYILATDKRLLVLGLHGDKPAHHHRPMVARTRSHAAGGSPSRFLGVAALGVGLLVTIPLIIGAQATPTRISGNAKS